jgi:hypothetical protein
MESINLCLLITLFVAVSLLLILVSILFVIILKMKNWNNDTLASLTFSLYQLRTDYEKSIDELKEKDTENKKAMTIINKNIGSLSSGNDAIEKKLNEIINKKHLLTDYRLPTPEESESMRKTILENINMEVLLSKNLKIARKDSTRNIIDNTLATYPDIQPEYVIKLSLAMIENFLETA